MSAFATAADVGTRLLRELTDAEEAAVELVLDDITSQIIAEVGRDEDWANELDPVPAYLKAICVEKAISAIANPSNLASSSETLGAHSFSQTFPRAGDGGAILSDDECRRVREAVYGSGIASPRMESVLDDIGLDTRLDEELPI